MTVIEKLNKATMSLVMKQPFYASLLFNLEFINEPFIETCCINGKLIKYNHDFIDSLSKPEMIGLLAHEILHVAYLHHTRRGDRDHYKFNVAADYAINSLLIDDGFTLPEGALYDEQYEGMSAELIYSLLPDDVDYKNYPGNFGQVTDAPKDIPEKLIQASILKAGFIAQAQKKCPDYIKRIINDIIAPKIDWREALAQFLSCISNSDYSWQFPNSRYLYHDIYLPGLRSLEPGNVILIIDTSGSIQDELISQFAAEIQEILSIFNISLTVIYCDDEVRSVQHLESGKPVKLEPHGGNGTNFIPGFNYIEEQGWQPRAVVYLTDGYCSKFPDPPEYPVLWAVYSYRRFHPPFGDTIMVEN
jgi:predicted metal-dependent peptidase